MRSELIAAECTREEAAVVPSFLKVDNKGAR